MIQYTADFKDEKEAQEMKSLVVEKIVDIVDNAPGEAVADDYNKLTVFTEGKSLLFQCELDGKEAQFVAVEELVNVTMSTSPTRSASITACGGSPGRVR